MKALPLPTQAELLEAFTYSPITGEIRWRTSRRGVMAGKLVGSTRADGYVRVTFQRASHFAHRLIWVMVTGEQPGEDEVINHIDNNPSNNSWHNLELTTQSQNCLHRRDTKHLTMEERVALSKERKRLYNLKHRELYNERRRQRRAAKYNRL